MKDANSESPTATPLHGAVVEAFGEHRHHEPRPEDLVGKTIARFECDAVNVWRLFFTDGTAVAIEAETMGLYHVAGMTLCDTCWKDDG